MGNISVTVRKVNKGIEKPLYVRYNHVVKDGTNDYFVPVGISINPLHLKDGRCVDADYAPEVNDKIQAIVSSLEKAVRLAKAGGTEPTASRVKQMHIALPALTNHNERIASDWQEFGKSKIEVLQHEIEELRATIATKEAQIVQIQIQTGTYRTSNLVELIEKMIHARTKSADEVSSGGKRAKRADKEAKLTANTIAAYNTFLNVVKEWNSNQTIETVDKKVFESFQAFCIKQKYYNNTINLFMQKFGSTMAYYQKQYELTDDYKKYVFDLPLREEQVIYLTSEELKAFRNVEFKHWNSRAVEKYKMVKDICLIMSETGLRLRDAQLSKGDISNGNIVKRQAKTNGKVVIPFSERVKEICERNNWKLKVGNTGYFNDAFRTMLSLCTDVTSLFEEITVVNYSGHNKIETTKPKWEHCSAHSLRRSMINQCLLRNYRYDQITKMTGHKDFEVFQSYVDRSSNLEMLDAAFDFLDAAKEATDTPIMKVA